MVFKTGFYIVILLLAIGQTNVLSNVNKIVNNSNEKTLKHDENANNNKEQHHPPPLVEVIHGKVNSVIHDIVGSMDDVPLLTTEVFNPKEDIVLQTHTSVIPEMVENENATSFEDVLESAVFRSSDIENSTLELTPVLVPVEELSQGSKQDVLDGNGTKDEKPVLEQKQQVEPVKVPEPKIPAPPEANVPAPPEPKVPAPPEPKTLPAPPPEVKVPDSSQEEKNATHDDIPSFSEWAKKQMAEVGKNKGENLTVGTLKLRGKNYASPDCGAKVISSNPEAVSPGAILSPSRDDYMLNPCNVKIWFVVELCESIQPQRIEIANFELFSSSPQDLNISVSDRFPTRDWNQVAYVQAKDERNVQTFPLPAHPNFAKYIKVELHSHYGSEHYCPISLFKAFGASELEVLDHVDAEDDAQAKSIIEEDESDENLTDGEKGNFLAPVKAAVMHVVQKATELVVKGGKRNNTCSNNTLSKGCFTPGYVVRCSNCSEQFYSRLFDVMCCHSLKLNSLILHPFIYDIIVNSSMCSTFGFSWFNETISNVTSAKHSTGIAYIRSFFNEETIAALCNYFAIMTKKSPLNISQEKLPEISKIQTTLNEPQLTNGVDQESASSIYPTKTLSEDNLTSPENNSNQTVLEGIAMTNETGKEDANSSFEATPPLEEYLSLNGINDTFKINSTEDSVVQPTSSQDDPVATDPLALDSLFPDEEEPTQSITNNLKVQKESVFVRLANRIKALEVNMSLSSQYLEELSRRYKKQVEELQRSLANMMEEIRLSADRENKLNNELTSVSAKVAILTATMDQLLEDRDGWGPKAYFYGHHGVIIAVEIIMLFICIGLCKWLSTGNNKSADVINKKTLPQRRHSLDIVVSEPTVKQRRPSEEALIPSSSTHQDLLIDGVKRKISKDHGRKKKKKKKDRLDEIDIVTIGSVNDEVPEEQPCTNSCCSPSHSNQGRSSAQTQTSSSQETVSSLQTNQTPAPPSTIKKKTGAFKKIVKKLF